MSRIFVFDHPIILSGSDGIEVFPKTPITNRANLTASIFTEQDITTSGSVQFNESNFSGSINVANGKWTIQKVGEAVSITPSGSFDVTGSLGVSQEFTGQGDIVIDGKFTAAELKTQFTSASIIFPSGSTIFGNDSNDIHQFTGSVSIGNDLSRSLFIETRLNSTAIENNTITEFRNVPFPSSPFEQTQPITEFAGRNLIAPFSSNQLYIRKNFAKKATTITNNTAVFNAISASAPRSPNNVELFEQLPATSENDFMFFRNGMIMESDALTVAQSGSQFVLTINVGGMGYELDATDEIIAWGKFNS